MQQKGLVMQSTKPLSKTDSIWSRTNGSQLDYQMAAPTVCSMIQSATRSVVKAMNSNALMLRCAICGRELNRKKWQGFFNSTETLMTPDSDSQIPIVTMAV